MASISLHSIKKTYDKKNTVVDDLNLTIDSGSFTVLVGPSGCGKTTVLRMIAGLEDVTGGSIHINNTDVTTKDPGNRDVAMVFQNYAIYPHMTVRKNIEFGLENAGVKKPERKAIVESVVKQVGLEAHIDDKPGKLSGGERQRVALARAISKKPKIFLMDEPLSNLDATLRTQMRRELIELHHKLKTTFLFVTHDQIEALTMGSCIVVMNKGKIMQRGNPQEIYEDPDNIFTAQFIGDPGMNVYPFKGGHFGFRPRKVSFNPPAGRYVTLSGLVAIKEVLGSEILYSLTTKIGRIVMKTANSKYAMGDSVALYIAAEHIHFFDAYENRIRDISVINKLLDEVIAHEEV